jgi:enterochelin esterase-like enzyme
MSKSLMIVLFQKKNNDLVEPLIMKYVTFFLLVLICFQAFSQPAVPFPRVVEGRLIRHANFQSQFVDARNIDVWLPPGYDSLRKYPVLYMHDGQMLFDSLTTWNKTAWDVDDILSRLIHEKKIRPCIVVGVWNSGSKRHIDYFPQKAFELLSPDRQDSLYAAQRASGQSIFAGRIQSDGYLKFLVTELKPFIDQTYSVLKDARNTFVAGSSMGGLISMYAFCEYPKVFGGAACLSTHWPGVFATTNNPIPGAFFQYMEHHLPSPGHRKIYFDYGTGTLDALYPPFQKKADAIMKSHGYGPKQWMTREFPGADHSERAWNRRFDIPLIFLLSSKP